MTAETDVVVIGGGATGCGVARDLAMRGAAVTLVERGTINAGTSGRSHGLLHSGARYADTDPEGARDCIAENRTLARIAGECVRETGGYFLGLAGDDAEYLDRKRAACRDCGIETETLDGGAARDREPSIAPDTERALRVPDAVVYPSRLVAATAASARDHGARFLANAGVVDVRVEDGRVAGVAVDRGDAPERIAAEHVVNAAGAWAGEVGRMAGVGIGMRPTRGVMVVAEHDGVGAVLNRCRPPSDGDIVVPHGEHVVAGTTSHPVDDPDDYPRPREEADRVIEECAAMLPGLGSARIVRRYWGVRPLYAPDGGSGRDLPRGFSVLDHAARDGLDGFTTVVGGKLTTYRLMAEAAADHVAARVGIDAPCRTAEEPLPGSDDPERLDGFVAEFGAGGPADADTVQ